MVAIALAGLLVPGLAARHATSTGTRPARAACIATWRVSVSPRVPNSFLSAVAAVSPSDVWAVGSRGLSPYRTLVEHWDGKRWHVLPSRVGTLDGVAALSSRNVWAVGTTTDIALKSRPLIEHWDGKHWTIKRGANAPASELYGVTAIAAGDVWAVGGTFKGGAWATFIEHWDGLRWKRVSSPPNQEPLTALAPFSKNDIWAVGWSVGKYGDHEGIQHWDGKSWKVARTRHFGVRPDLEDVAGVSSDDLWAVGTVFGDPLVEHWDGATWEPVRIPFAHYARLGGGKPIRLNGIAALSSTNVWVVGFGIEHWNGKRFSVSHVMKEGHLRDIAALSDHDLWAVGHDASDRPLILHYRCAK